MVGYREFEQYWHERAGHLYCYSCEEWAVYALCVPNAHSPDHCGHIVKVPEIPFGEDRMVLVCEKALQDHIKGLAVYRAQAGLY